MPFVIISLIAIIIVLSVLLARKQVIDKREKEQYEKEIKDLCQKKIVIDDTIADDYRELDDLNKKIQEHQNQIENFEEWFSDTKQKRTEQLEDEINARRADKEQTIALQYRQLTEAYEVKFDETKNNINNQITELTNQRDQLQSDVDSWKVSYDGLLFALKLIEQEKMEKLFYTIQIPEEYRDDMNFLLNTVAPQVRHPDIISKLVWQEYVKPALDATFKRIGIKDEPGIYKLTYLENNKCYIGKSTNVKKRIADHFKSTIGIESIAWQAVHDEMLKTGIWNWTIEVVGYFPKEQLNEKEKFYIKEFDSVNFGFNKNSGGGG